jgi:transcriptional regulator with XRE-family HTH domain
MHERAGKASATTLEGGDEHKHERLGGLLKRCRARIALNRASLGPYLRLPIRVGKAVTQEEVAEIVGISRQWYALLESDHPVRVSAAVLGRIADALMMDSTERATFFRLAVPELRSASLTVRSTAFLDAFGSMRSLMRRLWAASTQAEALTLVREYGSTQLAPDVMVTMTRIGEGRWDLAETGDDVDLVRQLGSLTARLRESRGDTVFEDLLCYTLMAQPGELITRAERDTRFPELTAKDGPVLDDAGWPNMSFAMANLRTQDGFVARLMAFHQAPYPFSEIERAQLSTLADLTSLALSGCVSQSRTRNTRSA